MREAVRSLFFVYVHGAKSIQSLVSGLILAALLTTVHSLEWIYVKDGGDFCLVGSGAGKYAGQLLKAGSAAQPKGCSACFVPATVRSMGLSWYIRLGKEKGSGSDFACGTFCYV